MALIKCKECGHEVSDKALECPNCGCPIEKDIVCEECGEHLEKGVSNCPKCGCPVETSAILNDNTPEEQKSYVEYKTYKKKRKDKDSIAWYKIAPPLLAIIIFCVVVVGYILHTHHNGESETGDAHTEYSYKLEIMARLGNAEAQYDLGACYYDGFGVERDKTEGVKWIRKAAEQENACAQRVLGVLYLEGDVVEQDYVEGVKWIRKAAEQGDAVAQYSLSACYYCGMGVEKDYEEAAKWCRKAAEQGFEDAKKELKRFE